MKRQKKTRPALWTLAFPKKVKRPNRRKKDMAQYRRRAAEWRHGRRCAYYCASVDVGVHHSRGRAGKLLLDERFWIPLCTEHHNYVHANPDTSREIKVCVDGQWIPLLCARGDWNRQPKPISVKAGQRQTAGVLPA